MTPLMPTQVTRVTAVSTPAVTFMATNLVDQTLTGVFMFQCTDYITKAYVAYLCIPNQIMFSILKTEKHLKKKLLQVYRIFSSALETYSQCFRSYSPCLVFGITFTCSNTKHPRCLA